MQIRWYKTKRSIKFGINVRNTFSDEEIARYQSFQRSVYYSNEFNRFLLPSRDFFIDSTIILVTKGNYG